MEDASDEVIKVPNSDVIKKTLFSLFYVSSSKTTKDYAWTMIKNLLVDLKKDYDFLKYIYIGEVKTLENTIDDIKVISEFDDIESFKIGEAIQEIIDSYKTLLGKKAGYFFLTEFKKILGEDYHSIIKEMGVDLRIIDLQKKIPGMITSEYQIKDEPDSNIAFLEKKE